MSVNLATEKSAILDHESWILQLINTYKLNLHEDKSVKCKRWNFQDLFDLRTPYMMDGQAEKVANQLERKNEVISEPKRKKRKKEHLTQKAEEVECEVRHIQEVFTSLRLMPEFKLKFQFIPNIEDFRSNNCLVRDLRKRFTEASNTTLPQLDEYYDGPHFDTRVVNGSKYVLPPDVRYVCDDVSNLASHTLGAKFDLIVMDPPWQNKYVRRRTHSHGSHHGYDMMTVADILHLPVADLLSDGGLLVIWCTNNNSIVQEFLQGLHAWGVELVATWYWLKVTKAGDPVTPLEGVSHSKQPYERVFLARKCKQEIVLKNIPDCLVFCSVPSGIHSHKPPLHGLVSEFITPQPRCLELFARSLTPGWMCYGLEVLRLQHSLLFEESVAGTH
ncbi:N(6)-adenine-specific methyltransferase METTL4-like [Homarus americanus]|uniref:N(6)-adenine-specific DNA methyltransferase METTL4-like n=1 Tax=Homarus americanus TaxID=6706 RepID=A0A8J5MTE1_HOMAM|nr:N(6)-adenine-specific methyltransferase METTL4-like [Homarus americanus]XP_042231845.1 N(6)-adenine-specific methyltransferase METTL4-like [Homarus americanus]XP_042231847.1 N(6)-adenine-specific methyltransferase METTL4-like [Homarus americanus]KAG7163223.1 N(6)-adenine-specific DNA methyltransferase METTL4-like [Homarus americanus]